MEATLLKTVCPGTIDGCWHFIYAEGFTVIRIPKMNGQRWDVAVFRIHQPHGGSMGCGATPKGRFALPHLAGHVVATSGWWSSEPLTAIICVTIAYLKPFVLLAKPRQSLTAWWKVCQPKPKHAEWSFKRSSDLLAHVEPEMRSHQHQDKSQDAGFEATIEASKSPSKTSRPSHCPAHRGHWSGSARSSTFCCSVKPVDLFHGTATITEDLSNTTVCWSKTKDHHFSGGFLEILLAFRSAILRGNEIPRFNVNDSDRNDPKRPKFSGYSSGKFGNLIPLPWNSL